MNHLLGYSDRLTLVNAETSWTSNYIVSTAYANGRKVSRLTPADGYQAVCKPGAGNLLKCTIGSESIQFNSGIVYRDPNNSSTVGTWILQQDNPY